MRKEVTLWSCAALLILGSMALAGEQRPFIGVSLDPAPLPDLLTKHLRLDTGQGIRLNNIMVGGPAERAGLDRDDIVIAFQGNKVTDPEEFTNAIRKTDIGTEITLEVIHLGEHKTVSLKPEAAPESVHWKYPAEADVVTSWHPGKIFRIGPDGADMTEVPIPDVSGEVKKFFKESYTYHHATDGEDYTIRIEGDPADKDSRLTVQAGDKNYSSTVGKLDALPEKYRGPAQEAVENARRDIKMDVRIRGFQWPEALGPEARRKFFQNMPRPDLDRLSEQKDLALEKIQKQMDRLQQRMKELEERNREMLDRLLNKSELKKSTKSEPEATTPSESNQKQPI